MAPQAPHDSPAAPATPLVESVPNFSEGRRREVIEAVVDSALGASSVACLDVSSDPDHNRSVLTLAGHPETVRRALEAMAEACVRLIDLREHRGGHPRMGAVDVIPLIPVRGVTMDECVRQARALGASLAARHGLPVYLYEKAAGAPNRRNLAEIRKGEFEGFPEKIRDPLWKPDYGPDRVHPTAGCVAVGAREFLIAYNINLASPDLEIAKSIARAVRESSGGLPCVKAMGVLLEDRRIAQVSMNMTDYRTTSLLTVFERVRALAADREVAVASSEIVGLVPQEALPEDPRRDLKLEDFGPSKVFERRLERVLAEGPGRRR